MQEFNTNDKYFITKKLSDDAFPEKTLDELKADSDVYVPAFKKDSYNCKIPASEFGKGGIGGTGRVIITDYDIKNGIENDDGDGIPPLCKPDGTYHNYIRSMVSDNYNWARVSVYRGDGFKTVNEDCPDFSGNLNFWGNVKNGLFKFGNATQLDIYRWHAIFAPAYYYSGTNTYWPNSIEPLTVNNSKWYSHNTELYINAGDLQEGIVYSIKIHTVILPFHESTSTDRTVDGIPMFHQAHTDGPILNNNNEVAYDNYMFSIYFTIENPDNSTRFLYPAYWGSTTESYLGGPQVYIRQMNQNVPRHGESFTDSYVPCCSLEEAASGELIFVKLNGKIYIMRY